jgi:hypothetical protein
MPYAAHRPWPLGLVALLAVSSGCGRLDDLWSGATGRRQSARGVLNPAEGPEEDGGRTGSLAVEPTGEDDGGALPMIDPDAGSPEVEPDDAGATAEDAAVAPGDVAEVPDAPRPTITALATRVGIVEAPVAGSRWIGYVRNGGVLSVVRGPVGNDGCPARRDTPGAGWHEVEGGGFVCVGNLAALTTSVTGRPIERRLATPPNPEAAMPFTYAIAYRNAPMYRWLPSLGDEREVEPERFPPRPGEVPTPAALGLGDGGVAAPTVPAVAAATAARDGGVVRAQAAGDAGSGPPRIEELEGAAGTPLLRRMTRGMYVSLDRAVRANTGSTFWRTQAGGFVRSGTVSEVRSPPTFQGVRLGEGRQLPIGFAISTVSSTYQPNGRGGFNPVQRVPRLTVFDLTEDPPVSAGGDQYYRTRDGVFVRSRQVRVITRTAPPADLAQGEKWIEVNLDHQSVVAYEGAEPVYVTVASTGRRNRSNPDENYETVQGGFRVVSKHMATTMDGNSANDGPYSIEDVPWVMYFEQSFALHGAFWHSSFGVMRSHGCVNLSPPDARFFFNWAEPRLPPGWHGAYATPLRQGTRVYVRYDNQALGERGGPDRVPQH